MEDVKPHCEIPVPDEMYAVNVFTHCYMLVVCHAGAKCWWLCLLNTTMNSTFVTYWLHTPTFTYTHTHTHTQVHITIISIVQS